MFGLLRDNKARNARDRRELNRIKSRFGDRTFHVLEKRSQDHGLTKRDRKHWQRILRLAQSAG